MKTIILFEVSREIEKSSSSGYIIGAVIALFILGYLVYSLIKPGKF